MDFLQRHLPRVYQAVQNALDYLTNVTAQIFGAPPDAPQPRNAQAKMPLRSEDEEAPAKGKETAESQDADHLTSAPDVSSEDAALEATEESMKIYGIQQDVENQAQETEVRLRKEYKDRRLLDHHLTISNGKDTFSHHQDHSKVTTDDQKPRKPEDMDEISCRVMTEVLHAEVHAVIKEEVQKVNQEAQVYGEHTSIKTEEKSSILSLKDLLKDLEPKRNQEQEVPSTSSRDLKKDLNLEIKEYSCSTSNMDVSLSLEKTLIIQETSEEATRCRVTVTTEEDDPKSPEDVPAPSVTMEYDDLDVPGVKRQHKKLVTPVSEADGSPCDQGEEARKTWQHLQETAIRLALHCDLLQDDNQEVETLGCGEISNTSHEEEMYSGRPNEQEDGGEGLEKTPQDPKEVKELSSEEKERSEEVRDLSKSEEDNQCYKQDDKARRRVHFSLSTEEREQMVGLTYEDTVRMKVDLIQEEALEPTPECGGHPPDSYPRPEPKDEEDDFGFISSSQYTELSMTDPTSEDDQGNPLHRGRSVWYDDLAMTSHEETCESLGDLIYQSVTSGFQPEETSITIPDKRSLEEPSADVPWVEEMQDNEEEPNKNSGSTLGDIMAHSGVDCHNGEGPRSADMVDGTLDKSPGVASGHWKQDGSDEGKSVSLEVISQSSEEIKVGLLLNEDIESLNQQDHGESKEELHRLWRHPSVEEAEDLPSVTDNELHLHERVSRPQGEPDGPSETTPDEGYNPISVQELDTSKHEQFQGDIRDPSTPIIGIEPERRLSTDASIIDQVQTAEDLSAEENKGSVEQNIPVMTETQIEEDTAGKEYENEDVEGSTEVKYGSLEEDASVKEEPCIQEMEEYTWYRQDSYQSDGLVTYSESNKEPESQKDQNLTEKAEESSECEVMSKDGDAGQLEDVQAKGNQQVSGSDEDSTDVNHLYIVSEGKPRNTSLSALGSDDELEGFCRHPETGFDLLSEIQSVINTSPSEQDVSEVTGGSEVSYAAVSSGNTEVESTEGDYPGESNFQTDNVVKDLDFQCMLMPGHPVDEITEDLVEENQTTTTSDEALVDQFLDRVKEMEIPSDTRSLAGDHIKVILDQNIEINKITESQDGGDLLSELNSMISMVHPAEDMEIISKEMEDGGHPNEETIAEKITIEEQENREECSPGLHLPEELGSLIEPEQRFEEEHSSSIGITFPEAETQVSDVGLDINVTSGQISENKEEENGRAGEDQSSVTLDEILSEHLGDQPLDNVHELHTGSPAEDNIEIIMGSISDLYSGTLEGSGDLLSNMSPSAEVTEIVSTMKVDVSDKGLEDGGYSNDEAIVDIVSETVIVEQQEYPEKDRSKELGSIIDLEHTSQRHHYSSIDVSKTQVEAADFNNDSKTTETDPSPETQRDLIPDHTVEKIPESKKEDEEESQSSDDVSRIQYGDLEVNEPEIPLETGSLVEEIDVILGSTSELSQDEGDLFSKFQSVKTTDHPTDVIGLVSATGEEDILDISKECDILNESAVQVDFLLDDQEKIQNINPAMSYSEEVGSSLEPSQEPGENQHDSLSPDSIEESHIGLDVVNTSQEYVPPEDQEHEEMDPLPEIHSVITTVTSVEITTITSTVKLVASDEATGEDILSGSITTDENGDSEETTQELCPPHPSEELDKEVYEQDCVPEAETQVSDVGLDINVTSVQISENKEEEDGRAGEDQSSVTLDEILSEHLGDQPLDNVQELQISLDTGSPTEDNIGVIVGSVSDLYSGTLEGGGDLLSNMSPSAEVTEIGSTMKVDVSDKGLEDGGYSNDEAIVDIVSETVIVEQPEYPEEDRSKELGSIIDLEHTSQGHHYSSIIVSETAADFNNDSKMTVTDPSPETQRDPIPDHTVEKIPESKEEDQEHKEMDPLPEVQSVITTDPSVDVITITSTVKLVASDEAIAEGILSRSILTDEKEDSKETTQELCPPHPGEELEKELHEQDSAAETLTPGAHHTEDIIGCDIDESSKTTEYFGSPDLEITQLPSMDPPKRERMEEESKGQLSNEEASDQTKDVIRIHTQEPPLLIEPPTHVEMAVGQERRLVDHKETLMKPSVEEDDDVDNNLLPHNTLDVSAQKSRVQLRRKTSIRRKQGQRQVTSESEPVEPPQPVIRTRPMGVPVFPGKLPIFAMAPAMTPDISHPPVEQKEEKPAEEEQLVKPKKGIPRHAGFGIPHPQMMQELQARLKKKKPNE